MSLERVHLRKLLTLFYLPKAQRITALRSDIRESIKKDNGIKSSGGDFHVPFWTDAKLHAAGSGDLASLTQGRIAANKRSRWRLYPPLAEGFLTWWNEKRRWINEPFQILDQSVKAQFTVESLGCVVKVENLLSVHIGDSSHRLVYPYFSEEPELSKEAARIGIWLLGRALPQFDVASFRILDVLRSESFGTLDCPLQGDEEELFLREYKSILKDWQTLRSEYP